MGRTHIVPYGLYRTHGFISANLAERTGFSDDDLALFWQALANMLDHDRSAARGEMNARGLYVFKHATALGNAPAHKLFDTVTIAKKPDVKIPRAFSDYAVNFDAAKLPPGVSGQSMI